MTKICRRLCKEEKNIDTFYERSTPGGITLEQYKEMLEAQNGRCAICKELPSTAWLCVDHEHTGRNVRGLLRNTCNRALGLLKDSVENLKQAVKYLESF